jgi:hypothetical protein
VTLMLEGFPVLNSGRGFLPRPFSLSATFPLFHLRAIALPRIC